MEHGTRIKVVRGIHIRIMKQYKGKILFGGVYGSTASGRDTEYSDIEMMYIIQGDTPSSKLSFLYRGIPTEIDILPLADLRNWLHDVELRLPFLVGNLEGLQLLSGDNQQRDELLATYSQLSQECINRFFIKHGSEVAYESYNKIRSLTRRAARQDLHLFIFEVMQEISLAVALINRKTMRKGYRAGIKESFEFSAVPTDYQSVMQAFMQAASFTEAIELGRKLLTNYEQFLTDQQIPLRNLQTLDEIEW